MQKVARLAIIETIRQKYNKGSLELLELSQETQEKNSPPALSLSFPKRKLTENARTSSLCMKI